MAYTNEKHELSFKEIVLTHLKKILELSTVEFRGGYKKTIVQGNMSFKEYVPDSRSCYYQAIENLAYVLVPHFDEIMDSKFEEYETAIKNLSETLKEKRKKKLKEDWEFEVKCSKEKGRSPPKEIDYEIKFRKFTEGDDFQYWLTQYKLLESQKLFKELNKLLKRRSYLASTIFGEDKDEIAEVEEE